MTNNYKNCDYEEGYAVKLSVVKMCEECEIKLEELNDILTEIKETPLYRKGNDDAYCFFPCVRYELGEKNLIFYPSVVGNRFFSFQDWDLWAEKNNKVSSLYDDCVCLEDEVQTVSLEDSELKLEISYFDFYNNKKRGKPSNVDSNLCKLFNEYGLNNFDIDLEILKEKLELENSEYSNSDLKKRIKGVLEKMSNEAGERTFCCEEVREGNRIISIKFLLKNPLIEDFILKKRGLN